MDHYNLQKLQLIAATCVGFDLLWRFFHHKKETLFAFFFSCLLQLNHIPLSHESYEKANAYILIF